jgi:hypothetical protein
LEMTKNLEKHLKEKRYNIFLSWVCMMVNYWIAES